MPWPPSYKMAAKTQSFTNNFKSRIKNSTQKMFAKTRPTVFVFAILNYNQPTSHKILNSDNKFVISQKIYLLPLWEVK